MGSGRRVAKLLSLYIARLLEGFFSGPSTASARVIAFSLAPSPSFKSRFDFLVAGGQGTLSVETLQGNQWVTSNIPSLPTNTWASCITYRSFDTIFVIAGVQSECKDKNII